MEIDNRATVIRLLILESTDDRDRRLHLRYRPCCAYHQKIEAPCLRVDGLDQAWRLPARLRAQYRRSEQWPLPVRIDKKCPLPAFRNNSCQMRGNRRCSCSFHGSHDSDGQSVAPVLIRLQPYRDLDHRVVKTAQAL